MIPFTYTSKVTVLGTPTPSWYPEREMTPVFTRVMEIGLLMCGVCFYPCVRPSFPLSNQQTTLMKRSTAMSHYTNWKPLFLALPF